MALTNRTGRVEIHDRNMGHKNTFQMDWTYSDAAATADPNLVPLKRMTCYSISGITGKVSTGKHYEGGSPRPYIFSGKIEYDSITFERAHDVDDFQWLYWFQLTKTAAGTPADPYPKMDITVYWMPNNQIDTKLMVYLDGCKCEEYNTGELKGDEDGVVIERLVVAVEDVRFDGTDETGNDWSITDNSGAIIVP